MLTARRLEIESGNQIFRNIHEIFSDTENDPRQQTKPAKQCV